MQDGHTNECIESLKKIQASEIEPLYWILEDAISANQISTACSVYELLCHVAQTNKPVLQKGLKKRQIERLKEIAFEIYDGEVCVRKKAVEMQFPRQAKDLQFRNEKELEDYLVTHVNILESALNEKLRIVGRQVKTDFEYACDIVVESKTIFYPIELKIGQTTHSVISQIDKYCFYFYRQLRYDRYKPIQGVVIGNGADAYSINEIRRAGHWLFDIRPSGKDILLVKV